MAKGLKLTVLAHGQASDEACQVPDCPCKAQTFICDDKDNLLGFCAFCAMTDGPGKELNEKVQKAFEELYKKQANARSVQEPALASA